MNFQTLIFLFFSLSYNLAQAKVKNVILLIGDGMGPQQLSLLDLYLKEAPHTNPNKIFSAYSDPQNLPQIALSYTYPHNHLVVDSACSATQLASGKSSLPEMVGLDFNGDQIVTLVEVAKEKGKATGLVSDTRMTHATPASFAAHQAHRDMENEIAEDLIQAKLDILLSGGYRYFLPKSVNQKTGDSFEFWRKLIPTSLPITSRRQDDKDLLKDALENNSQVIFSRQELSKIKSGKILGLFSDSSLPDALEMDQILKNSSRTIPTLKEMTEKSIEILSQNKKGFFLMVEGGQIDWAGHANDAGWMLHELLRFNEAIKVVLEFAKKNPQETLVVLTADHETGSFGFGYSQINLAPKKKLPGKAFKDRDYLVDNNFGEYEVLDRLFLQNRSIGSIAMEFEKLPAIEQTSRKLCTLVNTSSKFTLQEKQCGEILSDWVKLKSKQNLPTIYDSVQAFTIEDLYLSNLIGRALAPAQNIVWGTGGHTSTPVSVMSWGPQASRLQLSGILHHTQVGEILKKHL